MTIDYRERNLPSDFALKDLYDSVGWGAYTSDMESLFAGLENSTHLVTAWDENKLVGLARVISDRFTIVYLQDVLVHPDYQRQGIATELMERVFRPFNHVRQQVLLTDDRDDQYAFYTKLGFTEIRDLNDGQLRSFVRFNEGPGAGAAE